MRTIYLLLFIGLCSGAFAQNLSQSVVAGGGDFSRNLEEGSSITWTLGELCTEYLDNDFTLQQGFHQGELEVIVSSIQPLIPASDWEVFPNPADFHLLVQTAFESEWQFELHDILGRKILHGNADQKTIRLDLPALDAGIYLIRVRSRDGSSASRKLFIQQN